MERHFSDPGLALGTLGQVAMAQAGCEPYARLLLRGRGQPCRRVEMSLRVHLPGAPHPHMPDLFFDAEGRSLLRLRAHN